MGKNEPELAYNIHQEENPVTEDVELQEVKDVDSPEAYAVRITESDDSAFGFDEPETYYLIEIYDLDNVSVPKRRQWEEQDNTQVVEITEKGFIKLLTTEATLKDIVGDQ